MVQIQNFLNLAVEVFGFVPLLDEKTRMQEKFLENFSGGPK
jgi:hypothetical protein